MIFRQDEERTGRVLKLEVVFRGRWSPGPGHQQGDRRAGTCWSPGGCLGAGGQPHLIWAVAMTSTVGACSWGCFVRELPETLEPGTFLSVRNLLHTWGKILQLLTLELCLLHAPSLEKRAPGFLL